MEEFLRQHNRDLHQTAWVGGLVVACALEVFLPSSSQAESEKLPLARWFNNLLLAALNQGIFFIAAPLLYVFWTSVDLSGLSILRPVTGLHWSLSFAVLFIALEVALYWMHRAFHAYPVLWRFHAVHHADVDVDFSTAHRHHPGEAVISSLVVLTIFLALRPPLEAVTMYFCMHFVCTAVAHSKCRLPSGLSTWLSQCIVTPNFHRAHHCSDFDCVDKNFGALTPWCDKIFQTVAPPGWRDNMGLQGIKDHRPDRIDHMLVMPFVCSKNDH